jgi:hypothetical protein
MHVNHIDEKNPLDSFDVAIKNLQTASLPAIASNELYIFSLDFDQQKTTSIDHKVQISLLNHQSEQFFNTLIRFKLSKPIDINNDIIRNSKNLIIKGKISSTLISIPIRLISTKIASESFEITNIDSGCNHVIFAGQEYFAIGTCNSNVSGN